VPFATTSDLQQRWRTFDDDAQAAKASLILDDVTRDITRAYPDVVARAGQDPDFAADLTRITCNVARRRLTGEAVEGIDQVTKTRGPFTDQVQYRDRGDDLELTVFERRILVGALPDDSSTPVAAQWSNEWWPQEGRRRRAPWAGEEPLWY
jgi:hypothetical protein